MLHQRQGLALDLEPGDHLPGVHAQLDDLEGYSPANRFVLLGHIHRAEAAFTDLLQQSVAANAIAGLMSR